MAILREVPKKRRWYILWYLVFFLILLVVLAGGLLYHGIVGPTPVSGSWSAGATLDGNLTVMTYNIHFGKGRDGRVDLERIANTIRANGAQVVALQEVERRVPRSGMTHQARDLARILGMDYVYAPNLGIGQLGYGNAILSAFPILDWESTSFPGVRERRGIVRASLDVGEGQIIQVFCTHLSFDPSEIDVQYRLAMEFIERFPDEKIIMGDLNLHEQSEQIETLSNQYQDVGRYAGLTFPSWSPEWRIDYIFVSRNINVKNVWVMRSHASDHFPVVAVLEP